MRSLLFVTLCSVLSQADALRAQTTPAESRAVREAWSISEVFSIRAPQGQVVSSFTITASRSSRAGATSKLVWQELQHGTDHQLMAPTEQAMPFHLPGQCIQIGNTRELLVSGWRDTSGGHGETVLIRVRLDLENRSVLVAEQRSYPNQDFMALAFNANEGKIYFVDVKNKRLLESAWPGFSSSLPTQPTVVVTFSDLPILGSHTPIVSAMPSNSHSGRGVVLWPSVRSPFGAYWTLSDSVWKSIPIDVSGLGSQSTWVVDESKPVDSRLPFGIWVGGPDSSPSQFAIYDTIDRVVIGTGTHPGNGSKRQYAAPVAFHDFPGRPLRIVSVVGSTVGQSRLFFPFVGYGQPLDSDDLTTKPLILDPGSSRVDCDHHLIPIDIELSTAAVSAGKLQARLIVALRTGPSDPVLDLGGGHFLLDVPTHVDFQVDLKEGESSYKLALPMPIPNDPGLEEAVVLYQLAFVDRTGHIVLSNVTGTRISPETETFSKTLIPPVQLQVPAKISSYRASVRARLLRKSRSKQAARSFNDWIKKVRSSNKTSNGDFSRLIKGLKSAK